MLLAVAGLGYAFDTIAAVVFDQFPFTVSTITFLGEFLLGVWLVVRSGRLSERVR